MEHQTIIIKYHSPTLINLLLRNAWKSDRETEDGPTICSCSSLCHFQVFPASLRVKGQFHIALGGNWKPPAELHATKWVMESSILGNETKPLLHSYCVCVRDLSFVRSLLSTMRTFNIHRLHSVGYLPRFSHKTCTETRNWRNNTWGKQIYETKVKQPCNSWQL